MSEYKLKFYKNNGNGNEPIFEYVRKLDYKNKGKILKYIEFLRTNNGYLEEPYSKHIKGKIMELRIDFLKARHRIFYFTFINKTNIFMACLLKKNKQTTATRNN